MMKRDTLLGYRRVVKKFSHYPSAQQEQNLIDSHLEALDKIEKLEQDNRELAQDLSFTSDQLAEARQDLSYWSNR